MLFGNEYTGSSEVKRRWFEVVGVVVRRGWDVMEKRAEGEEGKK